ncbi:hypothetical protein D172_015680 [Pseudoalteromonas sp. Bsw20308]|nr:hypothetical protein [Pseudoalteromonas sp. Bsw20308]ALQ09375.1 hypothetical protein D172_015680 [Pseudoalteromonas sp. Bsw20308]
MSTSELNERLKSYFQRGDIPTQQEFGDLIDTATSSINNDRLPEQIDLTQIGENSSLKVKEVIANGAQITNIANNHLPSQIDLTQSGLVTDSSVKAGELIGDGAKISNIANNHLPPQIDLTQSGLVTDSSVKAGELIGDGAKISNIANNHLPPQIDLTQSGLVTDSSVKADELIGDGAKISNIANNHLPPQIDLTQSGLVTDSSVKAGELIGDGAKISNIANNHLPPQIDLTQSGLVTDSSVKAGEFIGDGSGLINLPQIDLPSQIDLTQAGTVTDSSIKAGEFIGDGSGLINLPQIDLPSQIDLTQAGTVTDSRIEAGEFIGDGSGLINLPQIDLPSQVDLTQAGTVTDSRIEAGEFIGDGARLSNIQTTSLPIATFADIQMGDTSKLTTAQHGGWLNQKVEALTCPNLLPLLIACVETTQNIDIDNVPSEIDGYMLVDGDLVLLNAQTNKSENRIWQVNELSSSFSLQSVVRYEPVDMVHGDAVIITQGDIYKDQAFMLRAIYDNDADFEYQWKMTASLVTVGDGLIQSKNRFSVNFASANDLANGRVDKVIDSALLKQNLTSLGQQLQNQMLNINPQVHTTDFTIDTNSIHFLDLTDDTTLTAIIDEKVTYFRVQDFSGTWGTNSQVILKFADNSSLTVLLNSSHAYYDLYKVNDIFYSYDSTGKFFL